MFSRLAIQKNRGTLFRDHDGVFAEFSRGVEDLMGRHPDELVEAQMWKKLSERGTRDTFYAGLHPMPGAKALWSYCEKFNPIILTGVPHQLAQEASEQKHRWFPRNIGRARMICCYTSDKPNYIQGKGDTLVDDRERNRAPWVAAGGIFILHQTVPKTINELKRAGWEGSMRHYTFD